MAEPGDAAAFIRDAPSEVLVPLLGRLSPKWILRMRGVCRAWRDRLCDGALLTSLHRLQPSRPLICFDRVACPDRFLRLRDYCVESLDLRSDKLRSIVRFTDNEQYNFDKYDLEGGPFAPWIDDFRVDYRRMENYCQVPDNLKPQVLVHASLNGHLLISSLDGWHVVNPATRQWVALPYLSLVDVIGFYECHINGDYRVLCFCPRQYPPGYGVLKVSTVHLRSIGRPVHPAADDHGLALGVDMAYKSPPIQFTHNYTRRLHWSPQSRQEYHILVFHIGREVFSWKRPPPVRDQDMRLLELPTGHLGLSVSGLNKSTLGLWRLEDYQNDIWVPMYQIQLALQQMPFLQGGVTWLPGVVSEEGDVLIETSRRGLLHCDRNGNLLRWFGFPGRWFIVRHKLRESLVPHPMFREPKIDKAVEPPFYHGLCSE